DLVADQSPGGSAVNHEGVEELAEDRRDRKGEPGDRGTKQRGGTEPQGENDAIGESYRSFHPEDRKNQRRPDEASGGDGGSVFGRGSARGECSPGGRGREEPGERDEKQHHQRSAPESGGLIVLD